MSAAELDHLLRRVPTVYALLADALEPGGSAPGGERVQGGGSTHAPAPANLSVAEHRHKLVRGLRWWVDAVTVDELPGKVGDSPARMCAWLITQVPSMEPEDRAELASNLDRWLFKADSMIGPAPEPSRSAMRVLPLEALERTVPVHVAADVLQVSVSTIKRRSLDSRTDGRVKLADVAGPDCPQSDLPAAWCAHCRPAQ